MGAHFSVGEQHALFNLLGQRGNEIFVKTDRRGFIVDASPGFVQLGFSLQNLLLGPHLVDLVRPAQREAVTGTHRAALMGLERDSWTEFRAAAGPQRGQWFELHLRCLRGDAQRIVGTVGVIRSIGQRKALEDRVFAAEMTDPLTGLSNRKAFVAMLGHLIDEQVGGSLALASVDFLKAINLRHGQAVGDSVLVAFAGFLRATMRSRDILSRFGGRSLAVLFPGTPTDQATSLCRTMVTTLEQLGGAAQGAIPIAANVAVVPIAATLDETIRTAELALFAAQVKGSNRLERVLPDQPGLVSRAA